MANPTPMHALSPNPLDTERIRSFRISLQSLYREMNRTASMVIADGTQLQYVRDANKAMMARRAMNLETLDALIAFHHDVNAIEIEDEDEDPARSLFGVPVSAAPPASTHPDDCRCPDCDPDFWNDMQREHFGDDAHPAPSTGITSGVGESIAMMRDRLTTGRYDVTGGNSETLSGRCPYCGRAECDPDCIALDVDEPPIHDEPPPDYGPPGSGAVIVEYP
jgi:hypothetical protein